MPPFKLPSIIFALSLIPFTIGAGDTSLVGCNSVGCPTIDGYDRCTVEAVAHIGVGLSRIHNSPSELEGFSLVKESMFQIKPVKIPVFRSTRCITYLFQKPQTLESFADALSSSTTPLSQSSNTP
ncbi:hypothetical protein H112_05507 [Trichophyton rubrum D6]|uniref:Uncharacterized protein n=3 Tax=Trichophyton TaxID=5550 RepID=A0A080WIC3_TRIRC|nr:uncharacterized protein TERG_11973 [Trichophyton rubrum CBS 118892]EZF17065.1 hypothetical protein H100_05524 [Trichophyton rubrum MR850]EZF40526.1 hypothetical protein H102_05492 [Trichophyton rubrum CBS 100081]EZF51138.1 hypothetical protein H103_05515 [Trichophyton rubrum CBS 288.86]EZF61844.1 hypothetical protein H104_05506 [Trichophyton rubrum CBS 289.86]EZF72502.1 hypothetical protein H105_05533 [Trichophyton soudanense CBS 452.61]EZF83079.1 hypothetical protein H110_05514 [Trichophy